MIKSKELQIDIKDSNDIAVNIKSIVDTLDTSADVILAEGGIEYSLAPDEFKEPTIVRDGGCGYGEFAIECAIKGAIEVIAFEPNPKLVSYCQENIKNYPQITLHNCGLWTEEKNSKLFFRPWGTASASITEIQFDPESELAQDRIAVPIYLTSLKDIIIETRRKYPDYSLALKLDIEGAEHEVIKDIFESEILDQIDKLWIEFHYESQNLPSIMIAKFRVVQIEKKDANMGLIKAQK